MTEPNLSSILDAFSSPILIAKPIFEGSKLVDFEVLLINEAYKNTVNTISAPSRRFSEFKHLINRDVPWFDIAEKTINGIIVDPYTYYSEISHCWFRMQMRYTTDKLVVVNVQNITEEKNHERKLKKTAYQDMLTELPNRLHFNEDYPPFIMKAAFNCTKIGILLIDIDNMKNINDSMGHAEGDDILIKAAETLKQFEKGNIVNYRFGDDEFMVIIQNQNSLDSITNITDTIYESFLMQNMSVSGGISIYPDDSKDEDELLRFADIAMHQAKKDGKNRFEFFKTEMQRRFIQKLNIQNHMTQAVLQSNFTQVYQPQFDVQSGKLRGFEALIRWHDDELGEIPPSIFIPMAEECGLIIPIGVWVLNTAFATLKRWQVELGFTGIISVNLSPIQLKQPSIIYEIDNLLKKYEVKPEFIEIEITEGIMIDNMDDAISKMKELKKNGL